MYPDQDFQAVAIMGRAQLGFINLRVPQRDWVTSETMKPLPGTFLLDREGRLVFKPPKLVDAETQRVFETEIEMLLARPAQ